MPNTQNLEKMFPWLAKTGAGVRAGSRPIGWVQMHNVCAIDAIEDRAKRSLGLERQGYEVKQSGGVIYARAGGARRGTRFTRIGTVREIYDAADRCARK